MDFIILIPLLLIFLGIPLLQIRKQNKRLKEIREFQASLQVGDLVRTSSGVHAEVISVSDLTVVLEIAPGVQVTWDKAAVLEKLNPAIDAENSEDVAAQRVLREEDTPRTEPEA